MEGGDRESLPSGLYAAVQEGRRNINGNKAVIVVRRYRRRSRETLFPDLLTLLSASLILGIVPRSTS